MATFKGFNTINAAKKFTLTDRDLIKRDLLNALLIKQGEIPGRPEVGTTIWSYVFDQNDAYTHKKIEAEIRRLIQQDERLDLNDITVQSQENNIYVYVSLNINSLADPEAFYIKFNEQYRTAEIF